MRTLCFGCAALALLAGAALGDPVKILSDSSWTSFNSLQSGWQTPGFDDSAWRSAYTPYPFSSGYPPTFWVPGTAAVFMWDWPGPGTPNGTNGPANAWLRKEFTLPLPVASAFLTINTDDYFDLYVDGVAVALNKVGVWQGPYTYDIKAYLGTGFNVIGVHAWDGGGWEWALVDATIELVPEPATLVLLALGGGILAVRARRRKSA